MSRTHLLTAVVVLSNVVGNLLLSLGTKHAPVPDGTGVLVSALAFATDWRILGGVALLVSWMLLRMALLSQADLTYVLPVTAIGYVLAALAGQVFLHEHISLQRWAGTVLIMGGTALVSLTPPQAGADRR